jgi:hypothetical protein
VHATRSPLQTIAWRHPKKDPLFRNASVGLAVVLGLGFLSFPIIVFATRGGQG